MAIKARGDITLTRVDDGAQGETGTGVLKITTAPSSYTTKVGDFTPSYRIALSTVKTQASVSTVKVGDTLLYEYYMYKIGYVDDTYAYTAARTSIRGSTGAAGIDFSQGQMLYTDPIFSTGNNDLKVYNNSSNGNVTLTRTTKSSDNPFDSTAYEMVIQTTGTASPGIGGFYFGTASRANEVLVYRIIAKIPTGYSVNWATYAIGNSPKTTWYTSVSGTGKYTEYIIRVECGGSGTFSTTGYFYLKGAAGTSTSPITWYVAYATCYDMTGSSDILATKSTVDTNLTIAIDTANDLVNNSTQALENRIIQESDKVTESLQTQIEQESTVINQTINDKNSALEKSLTNQLDNYKAEVKQYIRFDNDGLRLGADNSDFKTVITNEQMAFKDGDTTVAYVSNKQFYMPDGVIQKSLGIGNFKFIPHNNDDGGMSLIWED